MVESGRRGRSTTGFQVNSPSNIKGILKLRTHDDSLKVKYREEKSAKEERSSTLIMEKKITIGFKNIQIREYARTIGDNPSCSAGPPIGISWKYDPELITISVDRYEELRPTRRSNFEMIVPRGVRQRMLREEWNVTQSQIAAVVRANVRIKNQRRATVNNLGKTAKLEEMFEKAYRKIIRTICLKKSTRKQLEELEQQMEEIRKARARHQLERMEVMAEDLETDGLEDEETNRDSFSDQPKENSTVTTESHPDRVVSGMVTRNEVCEDSALPERSCANGDEKLVTESFQHLVDL